MKGRVAASERTFSADLRRGIDGALTMTYASRSCRRFFLRACFTTLLCAALPLAAGAQDSVPTALALALLRFGSERGDATILVGKAPPAYAADVHVPAGSQVLGSLVYPSRATVIVTGKGARDALRDDIERALTSRGWARFELPFTQRGGFVQESPERYAQFCKGTSSAVTVSSAALDVSTPQVRLDFDEGRGRCDPPPRDAMMESQRMQFPTLRSPATSGEAMRECAQSRSGGLGMSTATRVRTSMSPSELLAHYGAQLTAQGWQRTTERESGTWTMRDSTGTLRRATVSAVRGERPNCYLVEMSVSAEQK